MKPNVTYLSSYESFSLLSSIRSCTLKELLNILRELNSIGALKSRNTISTGLNRLKPLTPPK